MGSPRSIPESRGTSTSISGRVAVIPAKVGRLSSAEVTMFSTKRAFLDVPGPLSYVG